MDPASFTRAWVLAILALGSFRRTTEGVVADGGVGELATGTPGSAMVITPAVIVTTDTVASKADAAAPLVDVAVTEPLIAVLAAKPDVCTWRVTVAVVPALTVPRVQLAWLAPDGMHVVPAACMPAVLKVIGLPSASTVACRDTPVTGLVEVLATVTDHAASDPGVTLSWSGATGPVISSVGEAEPEWVEMMARSAAVDVPVLWQVKVVVTGPPVAGNLVIPTTMDCTSISPVPGVGPACQDSAGMEATMGEEAVAVTGNPVALTV